MRKTNKSVLKDETYVHNYLFFDSDVNSRPQSDGHFLGTKVFYNVFTTFHCGFRSNMFHDPEDGIRPFLIGGTTLQGIRRDTSPSVLFLYFIRR